MVPEGDKEPHKQEVEQSEAARHEAQTRVEQEAAQAQARKEVEAGTLDNDALGELLEVARDQARAEVEVRSALNSRAGWLLGFAGVILTLSGAQAQKVLNEASALGEVDRPMAVAFLAVAVVAVGIAAICALQVLRLRPAVQISDEELMGMSESTLIKRAAGICAWPNAEQRR